MRDRKTVTFRPQHFEALPLSDSPTGKARRLRVLAADIDVDTVDFQRSGAVEREDSTLSGFHLRKKNPADGEAKERDECCNEPGATSH